MLDWDSMFDLTSKGGLWSLVCDQQRLAVYMLTTQNRFAPTSQYTYGMGIYHFLKKIYETNKADIIAFTNQSEVRVDDAYHRAKNKMLALCADLKKVIKAKANCHAALNDRVARNEMLPLEAYTYVLQAIRDRYTDVHRQILLYCEEFDNPPSLFPIHDIFQRVCILLQTSFVFDTEGQRAQLYNNINIENLYAQVFGHAEDDSPSLVQCSPNNRQNLVDLMKEIESDIGPYAVRFRYYTTHTEKRPRNSTRPFFEWNVGGKDGVCVLIFYLLALRPQFMDAYGQDLSEEDRKSLFFHTRAKSTVGRLSLFSTASKSYSLMVGGAGLDEGTKNKWVTPNITAVVLRRTFATHSFVRWRQKESFTECETQEDFLHKCAGRMNTSYEELIRTYTATQTPVDDFSSAPVPLVARAPSVHDDRSDNDDDDDDSTDSSLRRYLPSTKGGPSGGKKKGGESFSTQYASAVDHLSSDDMSFSSNSEDDDEEEGKMEEDDDEGDEDESEDESEWNDGSEAVKTLSISNKKKPPAIVSPDKKKRAKRKKTPTQKKKEAARKPPNDRDDMSRKSVASKKSVASRKSVASKKSLASKKSVASRKSVASKKSLASLRSLGSRKTKAARKSAAAKKAIFDKSGYKRASDL